MADQPLYDGKVKSLREHWDDSALNTCESEGEPLSHAEVFMFSFWIGLAVMGFGALLYVWFA